MDRIEACRARYAAMLARSAGATGATGASLERAFALVPREQFVGPGPWLVEGHHGFVPTPPDDPAILYQDVLVALSLERGINNGQPSLHAGSLAALAIRSGERVVHIGAGTGYYTAILAELAGPRGQVLAYEIEPDLAARARANLQPWPTVEVLAASACESPLAAADAIYVSAGATHPLPSWLDALAPGGRLMFPLTSDHGGGMLLVTRPGPGRDLRDRRGIGYAARFTSSAAFIACRGARSEDNARAVAAAFRDGSPARVRSLWRGGRADETAWCLGSGWWLSSAGIGVAGSGTALPSRDAE